LEEFLGVILFHRRPFSLTPAGDKLYKFIHPFFSNLEVIAGDLQGGEPRQIRVGASTIVLRDHLPEFLRNLRKKYTHLKITLREGYHPELESLLQKEELDLAITLIEKKLEPGIRSMALVDLPLALLVEKNSPIISAEDLWRRDKIEEQLICLPEAETMCKHFQQGLRRMGVDWFTAIEVSSIDLIETYVINGFGIGLSVVVPKTELPTGIRAIPLPKNQFTPVVMGVLWLGKPSGLVQTFLDELRVRAKRLSP
jgi:DNA-binding transcriptional LysR family regulator